VTIHDVNFAAIGANFSLQRRLALAAFVRASALKAAAVITASEFARRQICTLFNIPRDRVRVTHLAGASPAMAAPQLGLPVALEAPYFVAFSAMTANKNIERLVDAFACAREMGLEQHLVLIGHAPKLLCRLIERSRAAGVIHYLGYVPNHIRTEILKRASALVFPSTYEGFGLPVLEAMSCEVPVACSNVASLPEVAGDAAHYFDPFSVEDIRASLCLLGRDRDLRQKLRAKGLENCRRFSWERTAAQTLDVYEDVLATWRVGDVYSANCPSRGTYGNPN
jgi:alpha-1,3-rhamnosyl/mannosyltransferase